MEAYELLGSAEKLIVKQITDAVVASRKGAEELVEVLEKIDTDGIEAAMLDPERRAALIASTELIGGLPRRLGDLVLGALIMQVVTDPRPVKP